MTRSLDLAREIVTDPARYVDWPSALPAAWATLMEARGRRVALDRIATPAHLIDRHGATAGLDDIHAHRAARIRNRIQAHMARIGTTGPAPLILPATAPDTPHDA